MSLERPGVSDIGRAVDLLHQAIDLLTAGGLPPDRGVNVSDAVTVAEEIPGVRSHRGREIPYSESELARVYNEHIEQGGRTPTKVVMNTFGASKPWAIRKQRAARAKGLLLDPPRRPKRSGGGS